MVTAGIGTQILLLFAQAGGGSSLSEPPRPPPGTVATASVGDPDSARAGIQRLLTRAATGDTSRAAGALDSAGWLAEALRRGWGDAFPSKVVEHFKAWS